MLGFNFRTSGDGGVASSIEPFGNDQMDNADEKPVPFDPDKKRNARYLVEPHHSDVLVNIGELAHKLGLDAGRIASLVFGAVELHDESPDVLLSMLKEAATHFPAETAIELLEREDPRRLHSRILVLKLSTSLLSVL